MKLSPTNMNFQFNRLIVFNKHIQEIFNICKLVDSLFVDVQVRMYMYHLICA